ncbi:MAG: Calx-beta domain-containing protein [Bacteroidota bacterium]
MKKLFLTLLVAIGFCMTTVGQIVITEISYNNPSTDDYEYLELYNNSAASVDLSGWDFTQGITYTFPAGVTINAGEYLLLSIDSVNFFNTFGIASREWTSGSLSNGGEDIILVDNMGMGIDTVDYDDFSPWPRIADGLGPSLILCDVNADNNDVTNWSFSSNPTGVIHGESMLFGSPGMANGPCATAPTVFLVDVVITENEGVGSVDVDLVMANVGATDTMTVDLALGTGSTATAGVDFTFSTTTVGLGPNGVGGFTFETVSIPIIDDTDVEMDETIVLTLTNATLGGVIAATGDLVVTITDNETPLPLYPIGLISDDANGDGEADSLNVECRIQGIVHGIDLQGGSNIQFTIIDSTGGIGLFSSNDYGYTVQEGDEVLIEGSVSQFSGLAQMDPDTIQVISTGNTPFTPLVVTALDESTESELVTLECVSMIDPSQWPTSAGGSVNIDVTNGIDTFTVRIDNDVDINGTPAPSTTQFNVTGIGGQFDSSSPFNDGYQLLPRYMADIVEKPDSNSTVNFAPISLTASEADGSISFDISLANAGADTVAVDVSLDVANSTATAGADFSWTDTTIVFPANATMPISLSLTLIDDSDVEATESIVLNLANATNTVLGDSVLTINIEDNDYPIYPIGVINSDGDGDGLPDSLGVSCQIQGIVYGIDLQGGSNIQFTIIDSTGGVSLFSTNDYGYTVTEGDEVIIQGEVEHFNGLGQMGPDTIIFVSSGNPLIAPMPTTVLDESTESELVVLECVELVDPSAWPSMSGGSVNLEVTNGTDTLTVRIDSDTDLNGSPAPTTYFDLVGIGGQFDSSDPRTSGYQLLPRYLADVIETPAPRAGFALATTSVAEDDNTYDFDILFANGSPDTTVVAVALDVASSTATEGTDFTWTDLNLEFTDLTCDENDTAQVSVTVIDDADIEGSETVVLNITSVSNDGTISTGTLTITITETDNIEDLLPQNAIKLFPNPASTQLSLRSDYRLERVRITNLMGQTMMQQELNQPQVDLSISQLPAGVYMIQVETPKGNWTSRWIKQ